MPIRTALQTSKNPESLAVGIASRRQIPGNGEVESVGPGTLGPSQAQQQKGTPMQNLPSPWDDYLTIQTRLQRSTTVDDRSWGRERALNRIVDSNGAPQPDEIQRAALTESRLERHHAALRRKHYTILAGTQVDCANAVEARQRLVLVRTRTTEAEWLLLTKVGSGHSYDELAAYSGKHAGALRVQVLRARRKVIDILAA
jgi:hypothetical protein